MPAITITISDLPGGRGAVVSTDGDQPAVGRLLTPAQSLAMDVLRLCQRQASEVAYGDDKVPLKDFANSFLDPERLGYAVNPEVRDRARLVLGLPAVEFIGLRRASEVRA